MTRPWLDHNYYHYHLLYCKTPIDINQVEDFEGEISASGTQFLFSWAHPSTGPTLGTGYNLTCVPLMAGIPVPPPLQLPPTETSANMSGLFSGVTYNCSIFTLSARGFFSESQNLTLSTPETGMYIQKVHGCLIHTLFIAPSGSPSMFTSIEGKREVFFSWSPPPVTQHNGVLTSYTLSCSPSPSSLPQSLSIQTTSKTVAGFSPNTVYTCSLAVGNSKGFGPPANTTFTTAEDSNYLYYGTYIVSLYTLSL